MGRSIAFVGLGAEAGGTGFDFSAIITDIRERNAA